MKRMRSKTCSSCSSSSSSSITQTQTDHISNLPQVLVHEILSLLSIPEGVKISCVSKEWKSLWDSLPFLNFDQGNLADHCFKDSVERKLTRYQETGTDIERFRLCMRFSDPKASADINRWIRLVVQRSVKKFDLQFHLSGRDVVYTLPCDIFNAETITVLKLSGCKVPTFGNLKLTQLQNLCIENVFIEKESAIGQFFTCCPLIVEFRLVRCLGLMDFKAVSDLGKLKRVEVGFCLQLERIEIKVPGLEKLILSEIERNRSHADFQLALEIDSKTCESLRELTLCNSSIRGNTFSRLFSGLSNVESLVLHACKKFYKIYIRSQNLRRLVIRKCENIIDAEIKTPNLTSYDSVNNLRPFYTVETNHLQDYILDYSNNLFPCEMFSLWFEEYKELVRRSPVDYKGQKMVIYTKFGKYLNAIVLEGWSSMADIPFMTILSTQPPRIVITNSSFPDLAEYLFSSSNSDRLLILAISSSEESKLYEVFKRRPNYSPEYYSSVVLAKRESDKYSFVPYWMPFSVESFVCDCCPTFYDALLEMGITTTLKATLFSVDRV